MIHKSESRKCRVLLALGACFGWMSCKPIAADVIFTIDPNVVSHPISRYIYGIIQAMGE
jgi:hypothetical protein